MIDWNKCAVDHANHVRNAPCIERSVAGLIVLGPDGYPDYSAMAEVEGLGVRAYFGNGGYCSNPAVRKEVCFLRRLCAFKGIEELAFAVDSHEGHSWTLIVRTVAETETLAKILFVAHGLAASGWNDINTLHPHLRKRLDELEVNPVEFLKRSK